MSKYNINFKRFALLMLPTPLRKPLLAGFSYAAASALNSLNVRFKSFRDESTYRLTHNGQVCHLRAVLNDYYDFSRRRITITEEKTDADDGLIYMRGINENNPAVVRERNESSTVERRGYGGVSGYDFEVNIPSELADSIDENRLKAVINTYKLASKRYDINTL